MREEVKPDHGGGFYVYRNFQDAVFADVPNKKGGLYLAPRTVLKCVCWGEQIEYDGGKLCFENLKPVQDMGIPKGYLSNIFSALSFIIPQNHLNILQNLFVTDLNFFNINK